MKNFALKIGLVLGNALLNTEKRIFWHTGCKLPLLRKFHAWQSNKRKAELAAQNA
jgi:hypothetical protein